MRKVQRWCPREGVGRCRAWLCAENGPAPCRLPLHPRREGAPCLLLGSTTPTCHFEAEWASVLVGGLMSAPLEMCLF